ncbi:MAG TPA: hypothetical protein VHC21_03980 [Candidatus Saccharimonadales bacterium]|nr:hypothetical protein [Candidatus Saccharimonadales bacterium]
MSGEAPPPTAVVLAGLEPTATVPEQIAALNLAGFSYEAIAYVVGVSRGTINNWADERHAPQSRKKARHLDDIRFAARLLIEDGGLEPPAAARWLTKENGSNPRYPILDAIREHPNEMLEKISEVIADHS